MRSIKESGFILSQVFVKIFIVFGVAVVFPPAVPVIYVLLAFHALKGPKQIIEAYSVLFILLMANPALISGGGNALRWLVFFASFGSVLGNRPWKKWSKRPVTNSYAQFLLFFFIVILLLAFVGSKMVVISVLKIFAFYIGTVSIFKSFHQTPQLANYWRKWFYTLFTFIITASVLVFLGGMGFEKNNLGFQGIFNHPQVLGSVSGIISVWFLTFYLFGRSKFRRIHLAMATLTLSFIYFSQARTGAVAVFGGFAIAYLLMLINGKKIPQSSKLYGYMFGGSILVTIFMFITPSGFSTIFMSFIAKRSEVGDALSLAETFDQSRGFLLDKSMMNFFENPITGIGFGVPSDYEGQNFGNTQSVFGVPVSASVEKGFLPTAMLEETGVIGALLTIILVIKLVKNYIQRIHFPLLWISLTCLMINIGESILLSLGGMGLLAWLIFGFSYNQSLSYKYFNIDKNSPRHQVPPSDPK